MPKQCKARPDGRACSKPGAQVALGFYLCATHEQELLNELVQRVADRKARGQRPEGKPDPQEHRKRARDRAAREIAEEAAGEYVPRIDRTRAGGVVELNGGLPTLGGDR
jgi:hypothetical protein